MKTDKYRIIHIILLAITAAYLALPAFNSSLWFDECYSIALASQPLDIMYTAAVADVHPILYYLLLKLFSLGGILPVIALRFISLIPVLILSALGYTHIGRDFDCRTGLLFSFFIAFTPVMLHYSTQIRMYPAAILFVTLTAVYARRAALHGTKKNFILFALFSVCAAYTHYFALFATCFINAILLFYLLIKNRRRLGGYAAVAAAQVAAYIPGFSVLLYQSEIVGRGYWIKLEKTFFTDVADFFLIDRADSIFAKALAAVALAAIAAVYILLVFRREDGRAESFIALLPTVLLMIFGIVMSHVLEQAIIIPRYLIVTLGIAIISFSLALSHLNFKALYAVVCSLALALCVVSAMAYLPQCYSGENTASREYVEESIADGDRFLTVQPVEESMMMMYYPEREHIFININWWSIWDSYKAFSPQLTVQAADYKVTPGRYFVIDTFECEFLEQLKRDYDCTTIRETKRFDEPYSEYKYTVTLVEIK